MTPRGLVIAGAICFALYLGAVNSEKTGDSNIFTPVLAILWPLCFVGAILWVAMRAWRRRSSRRSEPRPPDRRA